MQRLGWTTLTLISFLLVAGCTAPGQIKDAQTTKPSETTSAAPVVAPLWFSSQSIQPEHYWVGYGSADELEQAKVSARADLSHNLRTQIDSQTQIQLELSGAQSAQSVQQTIQQVSRAELNNLEVLNSEQVGARYYVALGFDRRPLTQRVQANLALRPAHQTRDNLLHQTPLFQQLNAQLGFMPELQLYSQQAQYYLTDGRANLLLRGDEISALWPRLNSDKLQFALEPQQASYAPNQLFFIQANAQQPGLLTYLQVFEQGETVLMHANQPIKPNQAWLYPDPKLYDGLITELAPHKERTQVLHWIMLCPTVQDVSAFEPISNQAHQRYQSHALATLLERATECKTQTVIQHIRR